MSLLLPFNYRPESSTTVTGSYTVPVGKFAHAKCQADVNFGDVLINSNTVLRAPRSITTNGNSAGAGATDIFTTTLGGAAVSLSVQNNSLTNIRIVSGAQSIIIWESGLTSDGNIANGSNGVFIPDLKLGDNQTIRITTGAVCEYVIGGYYTNNSQNFGDYWLSPGDEIDGGVKHIEVYPIINQS